MQLWGPCGSVENKKDKNDYKRPSVYFPTEDEHLWEHATQQLESFACYVRRLIKEDMEREDADKKLKRLVKDALKEFFAENSSMIITQQASKDEHISEGLMPDEMSELLGLKFD